jgi:hypothetical protein
LKITIFNKNRILVAKMLYITCKNSSGVIRP